MKWCDCICWDTLMCHSMGHLWGALRPYNMLGFPDVPLNGSFVRSPESLQYVGIPWCAAQWVICGEPWDPTICWDTLMCRSMGHLWGALRPYNMLGYPDVPLNGSFVGSPETLQYVGIPWCAAQWVICGEPWDPTICWNTLMCHSMGHLWGALRPYNMLEYPDVPLNGSFVGSPETLQYVGIPWCATQWVICGEPWDPTICWDTLMCRSMGHLWGALRPYNMLEYPDVPLNGLFVGSPETLQYVGIPWCATQWVICGEPWDPTICWDTLMCYSVGHLWGALRPYNMLGYPDVPLNGSFVGSPETLQYVGIPWCATQWVICGEPWDPTICWDTLMCYSVGHLWGALRPYNMLGYPDVPLNGSFVGSPETLQYVGIPWCATQWVICGEPWDPTICWDTLICHSMGHLWGALRPYNMLGFPDMPLNGSFVGSPETLQYVGIPWCATQWVICEEPWVPTICWDTLMCHSMGHLWGALSPYNMLGYPDVPLNGSFVGSPESLQYVGIPWCATQWVICEEPWVPTICWDTLMCHSMGHLWGDHTYSQTFDLNA